MGMSATQARYLNLIAQQSDLEFQGQQINESRTTLSEQTNNLYTQLQNMDVPTPPMTGDFTNLVYSTTDLAANYTLGNIRPSAKKPGSYSVDYTFLSKGHNLSQSNVEKRVSYSEAKINVQSVEIPIGEVPNGTFSEDKGSDPSTYMIELDSTTFGLYDEHYEKDGSGYKLSEDNEFQTGKTYYAKLTKAEYEKYRQGENSKPGQGVKENTTKGPIPKTVNANAIEEYYVATLDDKGNPVSYTQLSLSDSNHVSIDKDGNCVIKVSDGEALYHKVPNTTPGSLPIDNPNPGALLIGDQTAYTWSEIQQKYGDDIDASAYLEAIKNAFPDQNLTLDNFLFTASVKKGGSIDLTLYLSNDVYSVSGEPLTAVKGYDYSYSEYTEERTWDYVDMTFDSSGRISSIRIPATFVDPDDPTSEPLTWKTLDVTSKSVTDEKAYADAMSKYEHKKFLYDQDQTAINAQMSIIQQEDKKLELKLTRLDNERTQITTEIEALKKVIGDNIESSYKTFSG